MLAISILLAFERAQQLHQRPGLAHDFRLRGAGRNHDAPVASLAAAALVHRPRACPGGSLILWQIEH
jgi:hypothetical protein